MRRTRPIAGDEGPLAWQNGVRAMGATAFAVAVVVLGPDAHAAVTDELGDDAVPAEIIDVLAAGAGAAAGGYGAAAAWRTARWQAARRYDRMAADPARAAMVPPHARHDTILRRRDRMWALVGIVVAAFLAAVGSGLLPQSRDPAEPGESELSPGAALALAGAAAALVAAWAVWRSSRWVIAQRVERLSTRASTRAADPGYSAGADPPPPSAGVVPELRIAPRPATGAVLTADPAPVTSQHNRFGRPPWQIAYLRLFDNEQRVREFLQSCWRECGYVHLIRSAGSVTTSELRSGDRERLFIASPDRMRDELYAQPTRPLPPGRHRLATVAGRTVTVRDRVGSYPVRSLLCHSSFWQSAVDILLARVDVVILDLSGFRRENLGTGWELQRVVDRFPIRRTVLLSDPGSDRRFLEAQIRHAWSRMAEGSPNAGHGTRHAILAPTSRPQGTWPTRQRHDPHALALATHLQQQVSTDKGA